MPAFPADQIRGILDEAAGDFSALRDNTMAMGNGEGDIDHIGVQRLVNHPGPYAHPCSPGGIGRREWDIGINFVEMFADHRGFGHDYLVMDDGRSGPDGDRRHLTPTPGALHERTAGISAPTRLISIGVLFAPAAMTFQPASSVLATPRTGNPSRARVFKPRFARS
jgi:hypothetical protein